MASIASKGARPLSVRSRSSRRSKLPERSGFFATSRETRHLIFPVSTAGSEAIVDVDLDARTATVKRRSMTLWESLSYLYPRYRGPHNVAIRGNWVGTQIWRLFADAMIYLVLFHLPGSGIYFWWAIKAERRIATGLARRRRRHILWAHLCRCSLRRSRSGTAGCTTIWAFTSSFSSGFFRSPD